MDFPLMVRPAHQYSTFLNNSGLLKTYAAQMTFVPFGLVRTRLVYSERQMGLTMGSIQNRLRLKNLTESYLFILMALSSIIGVVSYAIAGKFFDMSRTEKEVGNEVVVDEENLPVVASAPDPDSFERLDSVASVRNTGFTDLGILEDF
jgi:hypothetical protein